MTEGTSADGGVGLPASLGDALDELADDLEGVERSAAGTAVEYRRDGVAFATRDGDVMSFRLRTEVVEAALHTPDTRRSGRGGDWIALEPSTIDTFAVDRALAWFESAWRLAGEKPKGAAPRPPREPRQKPH